MTHAVSAASPSYRDIAQMLDHALLAPSLTTEELEAGCHLALNYKVASVCILPHYLARCAELLRGSGVCASTTIGFPHGGNTTSVKLAEARQALHDGGTELDMLVNIGRVLSADWTYVRDEIRLLTDETHAAGAKIKIIFENCYLAAAQKIRLCELCGELEVDWVKTSTGFGSSGATLADVRLMREHSPSRVAIKASGGIRDLDTVLAFRELGANRCGASRTREILDECRRRERDDA